MSCSLPSVDVTLIGCSGDKPTAEPDVNRRPEKTTGSVGAGTVVSGEVSMDFFHFVTAAEA